MDFSVTMDTTPSAAMPRLPRPLNDTGIAAVESAPPLPEKLIVLKARALEVAKALEAPQASSLKVEVTEFRFGEETYAFASTSVREVFSLKGITPLPCTSPFILGVTNVRGRILPVIDIKPLFGLPSPPKQALGKIVIVHAEGMEVGLITDTIIGVRAIPTTAIHPPLPTLAESQSRYIRGVTSDGTVILDATCLLTGSRLGGRE